MVALILISNRRVKKKKKERNYLGTKRFIKRNIPFEDKKNLSESANDAEELGRRREGLCYKPGSGYLQNSSFEYMVNSGNISTD